MEILLIGGPLNGTTKVIPESFPIKIAPGMQGGEDENQTTYTICRTGDGVYYGVYKPVDDPSYLKIQQYRDALMEAVDRVVE